MKQSLRSLSKRAKNNWVFILTCLIGLIIYLLISISKQLHFASTGYDLTIFDQAVRHYSEFMAPASSFRGYENLLGDHFHPILALLAPLYWLYDSPITLLVAQALLIISACLPIYLYTKRRLGIFPAIFLNIAFIFNSALLRAVYFDFHEIAFAIPLIAWAIYLMDRKAWRWFYLSIALLLLVKEDMSMLVAFFGIYLLFQKQFKRGVVLLGTGVVWFLLATKLFIPYFAGPNHSFNYWSYTQLGPDLPSSMIAIVKNPLFALSLLFMPIVKLMTFLKTFGAFLGLTFFSPLLILAVPLLLERFLSSTVNYWQFIYHYGATLTPILVMATADSLFRLGKLKFLKKINVAVATKVVSVILAGIAIGLFIISPMSFIFHPANYTLSDRDKSGYAILNKIPQAASVCTTDHIAPQLGKHSLTVIGFNSTPPLWDCQYILVSGSLDQAPDLTNALISAKENGYVPVQTDGDWTLYEKNSS